MDNQLIDERVKKAYERFKQVSNPEINQVALDTLNEFHHFIDTWKGSPENLKGITFYKEFLTGSRMEAIASSGMAPAKVDNFKSIMKKVRTAQRVAQLFCIRRDQPMGDGLTGRIANVEFIKYVINNPNVDGARPIIYTNRFLLSIFIEIMTSIADQGHLIDTATLLEINNPKAVSFERLQVQIRGKVEESLKRQNLGNELTIFTRATIAYHLRDACKS